MTENPYRTVRNRQKICGLRDPFLTPFLSLFNPYRFCLSFSNRNQTLVPCRCTSMRTSRCSLPSLILNLRGLTRIQSSVTDFRITAYNPMKSYFFRFLIFLHTSPTHRLQHVETSSPTGRGFTYLHITKGIRVRFLERKQRWSRRTPLRRELFESVVCSIKPTAAADRKKLLKSE